MSQDSSEIRAILREIRAALAAQSRHIGDVETFVNSVGDQVELLDAQIEKQIAALRADIKRLKGTLTAPVIGF